MVKKLTYLLTNQTKWSLAYKPLVFAFVFSLIFISWQGGKSFWLSALLFLFGLIFYFNEHKERKDLRWSYLFLFLLSPLMLWTLHLSLVPPTTKLILGILSILALSILYGVITGLIRFSFKDRESIYNILNTSILALVFLTSFAFYEFSYYLLIPFFLSFFIFKEFFNFHNLFSRQDLFPRRDINLRFRPPEGINHILLLSILSTLSFLSTQIVWVVSILPFGIINSAVFSVVFFTLLRDIVLAHFKGTINKNFLLQQFSFLVVLTLIIFATTNWTL